MTLIADYYNNGYIVSSFKRSVSFERMCSMLKAISARDLAPGFKLEQKYPQTYDLRPCVHAYDDAFIEALIDSNVPALLCDVISSDMTLAHIQVRVSAPGPSYMDWHRDTYVYNDMLVGNVPPVHKLIFYPQLRDECEQKLKLVMGSHRLQFNDRYADMTLTNDVSRVDSYSDSHDRFILFDTSMLHAVVPDMHPDGSVRIIYTFMRLQQFDETLRSHTLHAEQSDLYEKKKEISRNDKRYAS